MHFKPRTVTTLFALTLLAFAGALLHATPPDVYTFVLKGGMGDLGGVRGPHADPGKLWYPQGIASDQGQTPGAPRRIYVADTQNNRIQIFDADGSFYAAFGEAGVENGQFSGPMGVVVDAQGWILVADTDNHRLQLFKPEPDAQNPTSFVWKKTYGGLGDYDAGPDGTDINRDPATRPVVPLDKFAYPTRVAIRPGTLLGVDAFGNRLDDGNGRVAVLDQVNTRVVVLTARLEPLFQFGEFGTDALGEFEYPVGVGMDAQRIYVADPLNHRIQIFNVNWATNTATAAAAFGSENPSNTPGDLDYPLDVQSDGTRLFVNDTNRNRVLVLNPDPDPQSVHTPRCKEEQASATAGRCSIRATDGTWYDARVVGGAGDHLDGRFGMAEALAIDPTGRLVVADTNYHRFQVFKPSRLAVSSVTLPLAGQSVISGATVGVTVTVANQGQTSLSVTPTLVPSTAGGTVVLNSPAPAQILPGQTGDFYYSYTTGNTGSLNFTAAATAGAGPGAGTLLVTAPSLTAGTITVEPKPEAAMGVEISLLSPVVGLNQTATVKVMVSNPGGFALENVTPTVTPNGLDPQGFVSDPTSPDPLSSLAKGAPAHTFTFTFKAAKVGQVTFTASAAATYTDGNATSPISATTTTGAILTIAEDVEPPVTVLTVGAPDGQNGWYVTTPVNVTLRATDNVALTSLTYTMGGAGGGTITTLAQGKSFEKIVPLTRQGATDFTYWATDAVNPAEAPRTVTILIDTVKPGINSAGISPLPNAAGWNNTFPTVRFVAQDGESGPAFVTGVDPVTLANNGVYVGYNGGNIQIVGTARDVAGNEKSVTVPVKVDTNPPGMICGPTVQPNGLDSWFTNQATVTVRCDATDVDPAGASGMLSVKMTCPGAVAPPVAGVASASCTYSAEGQHVVLGEAKDVAGNLTPVQLTIKIDRTPPTVTCGTESDGNTWPPNHKMVPWTTFVRVTDAGAGPGAFTLVGISSDEHENARGSGKTSPDMDQWTIGDPDMVGRVRAERTGPGTGRIYRLVYEGKDLAGHKTTCVAALAVPHDQGK